MNIKKYTIQCWERIFVQRKEKYFGNAKRISGSKKELKEESKKLDEISDEKKLDEMIKLEKNFRHKTLEERAKRYEGKINLDGEYDWGESVGREEWE